MIFFDFSLFSFHGTLIGVRELAGMSIRFQYLLIVHLLEEDACFLEICFLETCFHETNVFNILFFFKT